MFNSGFAESSSQLLLSWDGATGSERSLDNIQPFDDSDEDDETCINRDNEDKTAKRHSTEDKHDGDDVFGAETDLALLVDSHLLGATSDSHDVGHQSEMDTNMAAPGSEEDKRVVVAKLGHPSSPRSKTSPLEQEPGTSLTVGTVASVLPTFKHPEPDRGKTAVIVRDVAYATYRAILYYVSQKLQTLFASAEYSGVALNCCPDLYGQYSVRTAVIFLSSISITNWHTLFSGS